MHRHGNVTYRQEIPNLRTENSIYVRNTHTVPLGNGALRIEIQPITNDALIPQVDITDPTS